jgi:hypothetical protein
MVTFSSSNGLTVSVLADEDSSALTDGFGGWESVDRPKRVAMTRFATKPLFRQDIPILFDGWPDGGQQETKIATLIRMAQQAGVNAPPPTVSISGPVQRTDLTWVIENISWGTAKVIRDVVGGVSVRMRQDAVVHLMQYVDDKVLVTPAKPAVASKVVDGKGKTPKQLSQEMYGTPDFWKLFTGTTLGPPIVTGPRKPIPKGTKVVVPPNKGTPVPPKGPIGPVGTPPKRKPATGPNISPSGIGL